MPFDHASSLPPAVAAAQPSAPAVPARRYSRIGWTVIAAGLGGFLLWAALAPLDKGVPVAGTVIVSGNRKVVQHPSGGIVEKILVKDGDKVRTGQVLVTMNHTQARAQAEATRAQLLTARAVEARLLAERDGLADIDFGEIGREAASDPGVAEVIAVQRQLFASRRQALQKELGTIAEGITGLQSQLSGLRDARQNKQQQLAALREQLQNMRELAREGYMPRNRLLDTERLYAQVNGEISADLGTIGRTQSQLTELRIRASLRREQEQKEVRTLLGEAQRDVRMLRSRLEGLDFDVANTQVRAPVSGSVVGLAIFTQGGVVAPGARLMDVVPDGEPLEVEARVPVNLIDKVTSGLPVELMFTAFNQSRTPRIPAAVSVVSADRLTEEEGAPYYKIRAQVTPDGMDRLAGHQVRPGMPVEVFIKTGERTMLSYLFKPVADRARTALTEE
ncbi:MULTISPECIES: HlyD family type I secretion periplasmic adaptor subunit [Cupriavidus]|uniref:Membrane fusion protein (MFP) family protein n=1 Tax=Cupriavidus taiwanensis TaxID=164546 RepID=A0A9Q7V1G1_9BURK|nr:MULTISPECIES: HlyD family type I secretion periplasmic adaptor subunit [Cupriavidus]MEC3764426.1 HlyD family type I secretion periplasmic adaptor subunit [Cupriavidus sp. SS-3]SPD68661.1 Proteases secretion protein PrtE [Cupriavidus taiwanensis]